MDEHERTDTGEPSGTDAAAPWSGQQGWHVANWGPLGLAETTVKAVAILIALVAVTGGGALAVPQGRSLPYWLLVIVAVGYVVAIADRLVDREITAVVFVVAMVVGHGAIVYAAGGSNWPAGAVQLFAGLMLLGDLVKIAYFATTGARVRGLAPVVPMVMTGTLACAYLLILLSA